MWLLSYLVFNACLYAGQLVLYTLLFLPNGNQVSGRATGPEMWIGSIDRSADGGWQGRHVLSRTPTHARHRSSSPKSSF